MAGARAGNRNIFGRIDLGISTYSMALTPRNHCYSARRMVLKSLKCSAPFYEAPIRHESCQTTHTVVIYAFSISLVAVAQENHGFPTTPPETTLLESNKLSAKRRKFFLRKPPILFSRVSLIP